MIQSKNIPPYVFVSEPDEIDDSRWLAKKTKPLHEKQEKKSVSFSKRIRVRKVISRHQYSSQEIRRCWFDEEEEFLMRKRAKMEARLLDWGHFNYKKDTPRGLEDLTQGGSERRRRNHMDSMVAVFTEIDSQEDEGVVDEEAIAEAYSPTSKIRSLAAHLLARKDADEAKKIFLEL